LYITYNIVPKMTYVKWDIKPCYDIPSKCEIVFLCMHMIVCVCYIQSN